MNSTQLPPVKSTKSKFIIVWRGWGVKFHTNLCGKVYSLVADREATPFPDQAAALRTARDHNLTLADLQVVTIDPAGTIQDITKAGDLNFAPHVKHLSLSSSASASSSSSLSGSGSGVPPLPGSPLPAGAPHAQPK